MMKRKRGSNPLIVLCLLLFAAGCASGGKAAEPVFKGEQQKSREAGIMRAPSHITVTAAHSKEGPFQHPFTLDAASLEGLLRGIYFQKNTTFRWENPERMLTGPEAAGLAQKIVPAFASLGTDEWIEFRLSGKDGETAGQIFVTNGYLNFRILTIQGYPFLKKGTKAISHEWKLVPQEGQGFFPSKATVWNSKEVTNWIVVKVSTLSSPASDDNGAPEKQPFKERMNVFP